MREAASIQEAQIYHLKFDLGGSRGGSGVTEVQVILVRLGTSDGAEGWGFSYVLKGPWQSSVVAARELAEGHVGKPLPHPEQAWRRHRATLNRTGLGPNLVGLAAVDLALWDLWSKRCQLPLGHLLGGAGDPTPVYASAGFRAGQDADEAAELAQLASTSGYRGVKLRLDGGAQDQILLRRVRDRLSAHDLLMADANEKLDRGSALALTYAARDSALSFLEEPFPADDLESLRWLSIRSEIPLATGEHLQSPVEARMIIAEQLVSVIQPDLAMIGGITPALRLIQAAGEVGIKASPHFLPGLFVHLATACPNLVMLEEFPLLEPLFDGWPPTTGGHISVPPNTHGHGLVPRRDALSDLITGV
jgi:L-alanine-DL-glutamate epimerase-like enolase superfamily enzyme